MSQFTDCAFEVFSFYTKSIQSGPSFLGQLTNRKWLALRLNLHLSPGVQHFRALLKQHSMIQSSQSNVKSKPEVPSTSSIAETEKKRLSTVHIGQVICLEMDGLTFFLMSLKLYHIILMEEDLQCELLGVWGQIISMESSLEIKTCEEMVGKRIKVYST